MGTRQTDDPYHILIVEGTHYAGAQAQCLCLEKDVLANVASLYHGVPHPPIAISARDSGIFRRNDQV